MTALLNQLASLTNANALEGAQSDWKHLETKLRLRMAQDPIPAQLSYSELWDRLQQISRGVRSAVEPSPLKTHQ